MRIQQLADSLFELFGEPGKVLGRNEVPSNPNPLFNPHQMWRGIEPHVQSGPAQDRLDEGCDRSFSIGARDQDGVIQPVRISEGLKQR